MPLDWIVRVLDQLCEVLQVAHEKGIVHRDLKPSNMMLLGGRKPGKEYLKVLDFGIAKIRDDPESVASQRPGAAEHKTQGFIGTPSYGSPEQAMGRDDIDGRADLYSVGDHALRVRHRPAAVPGQPLADDEPERHRRRPPPFAEANPRLRPMPEVEHAILRVLAKDRDQRPQTARELFEEFRQAVEAIQPSLATRRRPTPRHLGAPSPGVDRRPAPRPSTTLQPTTVRLGRRRPTLAGPIPRPTPGGERDRAKPPARPAPTTSGRSSSAEPGRAARIRGSGSPRSAVAVVALAVAGRRS